MLYAFAFDRLGVVLSELYFVDPAPGPAQEGAERGVRLEVRVFDRPEPDGSVYAARPINVGRPVWRADLLESVESDPGSFDRTHHHPRFRGWEPGSRTFVKELSADPIPWVGERLADLDGLLAGADVGDIDITVAERDELTAAIPEIEAALGRLLARVHSGQLAQAPEGVPVHDAEGKPVLARTGWL
jgi:hypothetical protein